MAEVMDSVVFLVCGWAAVQNTYSCKHPAIHFCHTEVVMTSFHASAPFHLLVLCKKLSFANVKHAQ